MTGRYTVRSLSQVIANSNKMCLYFVIYKHSHCLLLSFFLLICKEQKITYHHVCIPRRVRQIGIPMYTHNSPVCFESHVIRGQPIATATENFIEKPNNTLLDLGIGAKLSNLWIVCTSAFFRFAISEVQ